MLSLRGAPWMLLAFASGLLLLVLGCIAPEAPPNVVLIAVDDLGWSDPAFMGFSRFETPHLDGLAADGVVFTDAYTNAPNCAPSRTSLVVGQYPPRHGIYTVGRRPAGKILPLHNRKDFGPEVTTLGRLFAEAGYATALVGKWHVGGGRKQAADYGFGLTVSRESLGFAKQTHLRTRQTGGTESLTSRMTDEAVAFVEANRERPFFLFLSHYALHRPLEAPAEDVERVASRFGAGQQELAVYAAMLSGVDDSVGRVAAALERAGVAERTALVLWSDNGGAAATSTGPLRGFKGTLYEGGIRVPLVIRWPPGGATGTRSRVPVLGMDLFPTLLELAGIDSPPDHVVDGVSLLPLLSGAARLDRDALFWHMPGYTLVAPPGGAIRAGRWKLVEYFEDGRRELYDLEGDLGESRDLASEQPERVAQLHAALREWRRQLDARVPSEPNPDYAPDAGSVGAEADRIPTTANGALLPSPPRSPKG